MTLTRRQRQVLIGASNGHVRREMVRTVGLRTTTTRYVWLCAQGRVVDGTVEWLVAAGLARVERGAIRPGFEGLDEVRIAMHGGREPSVLVLTDRGRAALEAP